MTPIYKCLLACSPFPTPHQFAGFEVFACLLAAAYARRMLARLFRSLVFGKVEVWAARERPRTCSREQFGDVTAQDYSVLAPLSLRSDQVTRFALLL